MKGVILAAGRGSRLLNITDGLPKGLVQVHGHSMIEWQVRSFKAAGIKDITIVCGYKYQLIEQLGYLTLLNKDWSETNMVWSLMHAREVNKKSDVLVSYSDLVYDEQIIKDVLISNANVAIAYDPKWFVQWSARFEDPRTDAESFKVSGNLVAEIGKPVNNVSEVDGQYVGVLRFGLGVIEDIFNAFEEKTLRIIDMTGLLSMLISKGWEIEAVPISVPWCEVDCPSDIEVAERLVSWK